MAATEPVYSAGNLPGENANWQMFRRTTLTRMVRIIEPFTVKTSEGPLHCEDGWLAIDARGYPYPIDDAEKSMIYELAE
ncbi:MAG: hypothetical protein ACRENM_05080 [Candidatus Dormibacteraceae bacterium]